MKPQSAFYIFSEPRKQIMRKEFRSLISLEEARSIVFSHLPQVRKEAVPLSQAKGLVLAEKIISSLDVPGFSRASMDGFAVRSQDTIESREDRPVCMQLAGRVPMGRRPDVSISSGQAAEVSTGSMIPPGADAVVMIEYSQEEEGQVLVRRPVYSGENIQSAGSDISFGEAVLFPGTRLEPREIGVLAALGCAKVPAMVLRVAVASTGNELVSPGQTLAEGQIYDINTYTIASAVQDCGGCATLFGILPDEKEAMARTLRKMAGQCDLILVSGSTSAGAGDMIYQVVDEIGELIFHGVNFKPGKPAFFSTIDGKPCLGLPGYPTSALTVFSCLAAPAIRSALSQKHMGKRAAGRLAGPLRTEGRRQMLAVGLSGDMIYPVDKGSGSITTLAGADGVIDIPAGTEYLEKGQMMTVELFGEGERAQLVLAGENSILLEKLAESQSGTLRLLNTSSISARLYLEDRVADLATITGKSSVPEGMKRIMSLKMEMGLVFRDAGALTDLEKRSLVGWPRDYSHRASFESSLETLGLLHPRYARVAKTHFAVAAAVASGRADLGYAEKQAALEAGLGFETLGQCEMMLLARMEDQDNPRFRPFLQALSRAGEA
jgi:putative molybdopterin biosynthesis protein